MDTSARAGRGVRSSRLTNLLRSDDTDALSGALQPVDKGGPAHAAESTAPSRRGFRGHHTWYVSMRCE